MIMPRRLSSYLFNRPIFMPTEIVRHRTPEEVELLRKREEAWPQSYSHEGDGARKARCAPVEVWGDLLGVGKRYWSTEGDSKP